MKNDINTQSELIWEQDFPCITLCGEGVRTFLHGQTTIDILRASDNEIIRTCWLSSLGKLRAVLEIKLKDNHAEVLILEGDSKSFFQGLESFIFPADKVRIESSKLKTRIQCLSLEVSWKDSPVYWLNGKNNLPHEVSRTKKANPYEIKSWMISQGFPRLSQEIEDKCNPYEIGLSDLIDLKKGCYLGQEAMAKIFTKKALKQKLRLWELHSKEENYTMTNSLKILDVEGRPKGIVISIIKKENNITSGLALIKTNSLLRQDLYLEGLSEKLLIKVPIGFKSFLD